MVTLNIEDLRKACRPLWMTHWDVENVADFLGGGGDLWSDRLHAEWARDAGEDVTVAESLN
ncbi:MAG: hypothetical protein ACUVSA_00170 [Desulfosoma sp.]|uniref:hypothetical protein n=1 Tax=Desulfosoma sp. TaxID=2603217 RepID=UPI00404A021F